MKEVSGYNISEQEFKKISKWASDVYNIAVIIDYCLVVGIKRVSLTLSPSADNPLCQQSAGNR